MSPKRSTTEDPDDPDYVPEWGRRREVPAKIFSLQVGLYQKAKREPGFRFYSLYGLILREDVLMAAWKQVRGNRGAPGVDGVTIDQIDGEKDGPKRLVESLQEELRSKCYKPQPVRRVYIPKPDGRERPLGIPTVRDRVVQAAALMILDPIFEADFEDCSFAFRPERSARQALAQIREQLKRGYREVYDADLQGYFDSIPHNKLMEALRVRVVDRSVLRLLRLWLEAPVSDEREGGSPRRSRQGTPQGGVISPLLANIYLHRFDRRFHEPDGPACWAGAKLIRYADDFVVLARYMGPRLLSWVETVLESELGLVVNREKTRIVDLDSEGASLHFLGYTFRYDRDLFGRPHKYLNVFPSKRSIARERGKIRNLTDSRQCFQSISALIRRLNVHLAGWANYFSYGYPAMAFREINRYARLRLTRHLHRRSQRRYRPPKDVSYYAHLADLGFQALRS